MKVLKPDYRRCFQHLNSQFYKAEFVLIIW